MTMKQILTVGLALTVSPIFAVNLYFKNGDDKSWECQDNWYGDEACTSPVSTLPVGGDCVTIVRGADCEVGASVSVPGGSIKILETASLTLTGGTVQTRRVDGANPKCWGALTVYGSLVMESGALDLYDFSIQARGHVELKNGTLKVSNVFNNIAANTGTTGFYLSKDVVVSAGTAIGYGAPGGVIADLAESPTFPHDTYVRVPSGDQTMGTLLVTNSALTIYGLDVTYHSSSSVCRTGIVEVVDSTLMVTGGVRFCKANASAGADNGEIIIRDKGAVLVPVWTEIGAANPEKKSIITVMSGGVLATSSVNPDVSPEDFASSKVATLKIFGDTALDVLGGSVYAADAFYVCGGAKVNLSAGLIRSGNLYAGYEGVDKGDVEVCLTGGSLVMTKYKGDAASNLCIGGGATANAEGAPTTFTISGGVITNLYDGAGTVYLGGNKNGHRSRLEISGTGTIDGRHSSTRQPYLKVLSRDTSELSIKGDACSVNFNELQKGEFNLLVEYILDKSPNHIAPLHLWRKNVSAGRTGDLRLRLDGGVLLTTNTQFTILKQMNIDLSDADYDSKPDARLWNVEKTAKREVSATLTDALASIAVRRGGSYKPVEALPMGSVDLVVGSTNRIRSVSVNLALVDSQGATLGGDDRALLVANLHAAGYAAELTESGVVIVFQSDELRANAVHRFVWDFTRYGGIRNLNATEDVRVSALDVTCESVDTGLILIFR